ncbi:MAG: cell division protein ZapA [Deltaproteobacteria bacterium]|nr:cell division protein ZapA [Deltaproteobacteria bacterium]
MEEPLSINILGQTLLVKTPQGEDVVKRVASHLEERIDEVRKTGITADSLRLLLYVAFQMADENIRAEDERSGLEKAIEEASDRMLEIIKLDEG